MSLLGQGVVAIWNDVAPEGRAAFYEWHNREHMPERVGIAGFLRGRRYAAIAGAAEYFTLYEAANTGVLTGPHYLERLNNPTPATRHVIPAYFRNMVRGVCQVRFSAGVGIGGAIVTLRLGTMPDQAAELERRIAERLSTIAATSMVTGAHLCVADSDASTIATAERKSHGASVPDWLVMIEAVAPDHANEACEVLLAADLRRHGARDDMQRGLYGLEICLTKP
jgi:hypothetical protein